MATDSQDTIQNTLALLRSQAADGSPEAVFKLGLALVSQSQVDEALDCYRRAATAGHAGAQVQLGRMLLYGIACDAAPTEAVEWLLRAETEGNDVMAGYLLAMVALGGVALPRDPQINRRVLAAVQAEYPPAMLAAAIHFGRKPDDADQARCMHLLERATQHGEAMAARLLVERLRRGEGCQAQPERAAQLAQRLAAHNVPPLPATSAAVPAMAEGLEPTPGMLTLEDALFPPPTVALSQRPRVSMMEQLLSADECRLLIASAQPRLSRSRAVDPVTGEPQAMELRTSSDTSIDPVQEDLALRLVQLRLARAAGTELVQAEHLVVLRYAPGEQYRPHRDYLPPEALAGNQPQAGNRIRSICTYLNPVEAGGETQFPSAAITVAPSPGRAVVFDNLLADGKPDPDSLHAGLPVQRGEKWLATLWLRERRYRDY